MKHFPLIAFLLISIFFSCDNNIGNIDKLKIEDNSLSYTLDNLNLMYSGNTTVDDNLSLELKLTHFGKKLLIDKLLIDLNSSGSRLNISNSLIEKAYELKNFITPEEAILVENSIENLINEQAFIEDSVKIKSGNLQGLFFYRSIFKAINRHNADKKLKGKAEVKITPYKGFITNLTPFVAEEDIVINIPHFKSYLNNYEGSKLTKNDITYIINKIENFDDLNLKEYLALVHEPLQKYKSNSNSECILLCGGDCGCCGNYEGQCYYGHVYCYIHDYLCESCSPSWFCFSGCKPTPC